MDSLGNCDDRFRQPGIERPECGLGIGDCRGCRALVCRCAGIQFRETIGEGRIEMMNKLRELWWKIYPNTDKKHCWYPVIWLPFMIWFFVDPALNHRWASGVGRQYSLRPGIHLAVSLFVLASRAAQALCGLRMMGMSAALVFSQNGAVAGLLVFAVGSGAFTARSRGARSA